MIAQQILKGETGKFGTYHLVARGETTWYGYAQKVVEIANRLGVNTKVAANVISPIPTEAYPLAAPRPKNSRLSTYKICTVFNIEIPDWSMDVEDALSEIIYKSPHLQNRAD